VKPRHPKLTDECQSVSEVLARVGDKWTVLVVGLLGNGPMRFSELRRGVDGISQKMLTTTCASSSVMVSAPGRCSQPCHRASNTS